MTVARTQTKSCLTLAVTLLVSTNAWAQPKLGFWLVGNPPGTTSGWVTSLSQDGTVAAGLAGGQGIGPGYTWIQTGGRNDFGLLPGMPVVSYAYGNSNNGVVAGNMRIDGQYAKSRAYRWTGTGPLQDLGLLPGETRSFAWGVSGDGTIVVGHAENGSWSFYTGQAFRWTAAGGMQGLGKLTPTSLLSVANAVSRNGATIVGENWNEFSHTDAFLWTQAGGMKALPSLTGGSSTADAVNFDGSIIAGRSAGPDTWSRMVRWKNGVIEDLSGNTFGGSGCVGYALSDDGGVVAGVVGGLAIVWTQETGCVTAADFLALKGVTVPDGWLLQAVNAVSGDGRTMGGRAKNLATGKMEGFVATISGGNCSADCDVSGTLDIDDFICFQTRFAISDPYADCDASGELDIDDFICFQTGYAAGC